MPVKERYRMVRESYFNSERNTAKSTAVDFFFPPKISDDDEVPGEYCLDYEKEKSLKELFAIKTMSRYNKFGFTINAAIHFDFEDEEYCNNIDSLDETYARYCKFHLGI